MPEIINSSLSAPLRQRDLRSSIRALRSLIVLISCAVSGLAQRPSEVYNGREVGEGRLIVKLRTPSADNLARYRQLLDADSVEQIGGQTGPIVFHSSSRAVRAMMST